MRLRCSCVCGYRWCTETLQSSSMHDLLSHQSRENTASMQGQGDVCTGACRIFVLEKQSRSRKGSHMFVVEFATPGCRRSVSVKRNDGRQRMKPPVFRCPRLTQQDCNCMRSKFLFFSVREDHMHAAWCFPFSGSSNLTVPNKTCAFCVWREGYLYWSHATPTRPWTGANTNRRLRDQHFAFADCMFLTCEVPIKMVSNCLHARVPAEK